MYGGILNPNVSSSGSSTGNAASNALLSQHNLLAHTHNALLAANSTTVISSSASAMFLHNAHNAHGGGGGAVGSDSSAHPASSHLSMPGGLQQMHSRHSAGAGDRGASHGHPNGLVNNASSNHSASHPLSGNAIVSASTTTIVNSNAVQSQAGGSGAGGGSSTSAAANAKSERKPLCARCRNHNVMIAVKGHKRYCEFRDCECEKCLLTQERRVIMAKQVALSRHQSEDLQAGRIGHSARMPIIKRISSECKGMSFQDHFFFVFSSTCRTESFLV